MRQVYIFGAHSRAQTLGVYLTKLNSDLEIVAYLVNNDEANDSEINGVPVIHIDNSVILNTSIPVYIGTRGVYHDDITSLLKSLGMQEMIPVTPELDMQLRNEYLQKHYAEMGRKFDKIDKYTSACVYVVKSAFDKPLQQQYSLSPYNVEIQVGAALTDKRIANVTDDIGFSISDKNKQFCELTALYWIWKNAKEDIVGLEHYRRHFLLPDNWKDKMVSEKIDVILPTPLYVAPSLAQNYRDRHVADDWEYMMKTLKLLYPEEYSEAKDFFDTNLYSPCNMFIMKKEILNDLCSWMFPILFICAEHGGQREDTYQNRYPGFLSERLLSFFFEKNRDKYKVVYADKNFLA